MANINKNIIMQAGAAVANATNKAAGLSASTPEPGSIISAIQLVNGGRTIGPATLAHFTESVRNKLLSLLVSMEPIQSGSGTPSPNNVRPISGRTGVSVYRTGKNLFDKSTPISRGQYVSGSWIDLDTRITTDFIPFAAETEYEYTMSIDLDNSEDLAFINYNYFDENKTWLGDRATNGDSSFSGQKTKTFTIHNPNAKFIRITCRAYSDINLDIPDKTLTNADLMLELGSTASTYSPYTGNTYAVDWTTEAGTVYGGTLDVVTGVLTVDRANIASYNGEVINEPWLSSMDAYTPGATPTTGAQVVYTLATPLTYQLTPQDIITLLGDNYIWSDSGDVTITE